MNDQQMQLPKIYLCGPINGRTDAECIDWREEVKRLWRGETLDPMRRDYRGREQMLGIAKLIVEDDLQDLRDCWGVLAYFDKPSVGTSMEIFYAAYVLGKPVVLVNASGSPKLTPWLQHHSDYVAYSLSQALSRLESLALYGRHSFAAQQK